MFVDALIIITPPVIVHRMTSHFGYSYNNQYEQAHHAVVIAKSHAALVKLFQDDEKNKKLICSSLCKDEIPSNNEIT
jgi:hypothetical protein